MRLYEKDKGYSLMEIVVALAIGSIGIMAFLNFTQMSSKLSKRVTSATSTKGDSQVFSRYVSKGITSGNLRFYGYTSTAKKFRLLIPLPGLCGDLKTRTSCSEDISLLYVKYDKTTSPALSAICRMRAANKEYAVFDLNNLTFGEGELDGENVKVSRASNIAVGSGLVNLKKDSIISFLDPPFSYVWLVKNGANKYTVTQDALGNFDKSEFHGGCRENLQIKEVKSGVTFYKTDNLVAAEIAPLILSEYLEGKTSPPLDLVTLNDTIFPLRSFNIRFEVVGRLEKNGKDILGISRCAIKNNKLECAIHQGLKIDNLERTRIDQKFKIALKSNTNQIMNRNSWYESISVNMKKTCEGNDCFIIPLIVDSVENLPYLSSVDETNTNLLSEGFSLLKQEELEVIKIRYKEKGKRKEGFFDVAIP